MIDLDLLRDIPSADILGLSGLDGSTARAIAEGREAALNGRDLSADAIDGIRRCLEHGGSRAVEIAALVVRALQCGPGPQKLIADLARSKLAQGRISAVMCLTSRFEGKFIAHVLESLAKDRSKKVRELAVDWVVRNNQREFLPILEQAHTCEREENMKEYLAQEIRLLRDGYSVARGQCGAYVTVHDGGSRFGGHVNLDAAHGLTDAEIAKLFVSGLQPSGAGVSP